jgi:hypothetical protein
MAVKFVFGNKVLNRIKVDLHRHDPTTTRQKNIVTVTLNGPVNIQRQRHVIDNRQTVKESEPVGTCLSSQCEQAARHKHSQLLFFPLLKADHISLIMNTEQLIELVSVNPLLYDLNHKYSDVKLK